MDVFKIAELSREQQVEDDFKGIDDSVINPKHHKLTKEQETYQRMVDVYKEYQANIKKSSLLKGDILKGIESDSIESLFLQACEVISLMTGEDSYMDMVKAGMERRKQHAK